MKTRGPHPHKALSATRVRALKKPGRYGDGNGLYLIVDDSGSKRWMLRTVVQGRRRDIGLGGLSLVSLAEAREEAASMRRIARKGEDPLAERRKARQNVPTFEEAARTVHAEHKDTWKNEKHAAQWISTLKSYVFPVFGDRAVNQVGTPDVLQALSKIWLTKPETARRVRQRIGTVLDWAKAAGHRSGDNPIDGIQKGLPKQPKQDGHHAALPYGEVTKFIARLGEAKASEITKLAFEFLILTATRTNEVILAEWSEIDFKKKIWTIPAERMKAGKTFRVPLSSRCIKILERAKQLTNDGQFIFPGRTEKKSLSTMAFLMVIRRLGLGNEITGHGFRSTFKDWSVERTNFPGIVSEMALAHQVPDKTEAAYLRGDLFDKRKELMETWAIYACTDNDGKVITLRKSSA